MPGRTQVSLSLRRALNQAMLHSQRVPACARRPPGKWVRALRSALRMSQAQLARRCGVPRAHITRLESGDRDVQWSTILRLFDAMFCDVLLLPLARKRPSDAVAERYAEKPPWTTWLWD